MRIAVIGTGGVGGYFGGRLARAGQDVVFVARGEHLRALQQSGLTVKSLHGDFHLAVHATDDPRQIGVVDLVLFTVKSYDTEAAAQAIRPIVGPGTAVLSLQNGVENEAKLEQILGVGRILGGVTHIESTIAAPGVIHQTSPLHRLTFGELSGGRSARVDAIQAVFRAAELDSHVAEDIRLPLWQKFLFICAMAGVTTLARAPIGAVLACSETRDLFERVLREVEAVARAHGVPLEPEIVEQNLRFAAGLPPDMKSSMQRDLERGHRLEIDALNGAAVRLGAAKGVPTPCNFTIYAALKLAQPA